MRLSDNDIKKLRPLIAEKLNQIPNGSSISLDKELLKRLLFDFIFDPNTKTIAKFPVWSGSFLTKIANLSEISFDGIVLDPLSSIYQEVFPENSLADILSIYQNIDGALIKYGKLDITIDISKSFTILYYNHQKSINPDTIKPILTSVDLSHNALVANDKPCPLTNYFSLIYDSDISYTNANIIMSEEAQIKYSNLTGLDLSDYTLNYRVLSSLGLNRINLYRSNLSDTGLNLVTDNKEGDEKAREALAEAIKDGYLTHCTINKVVIESPAEREIKRIEKMQEYESYKRAILEKIDLDILKASITH